VGFLEYQLVVGQVVQSASASANIVQSCVGILGPFGASCYCETSLLN
jgi:hypothetical protein